MKGRDTELLLRDLCARLPYNTIVSMAEGGVDRVKWNKVELTLSLLNQIEEEGAWEFVKPYLRPMSSMTEDEKEEYEEVIRGSFEKQLEFYLRNHLDFRGLIEKGLALEALDGMYNK